MTRVDALVEAIGLYYSFYTRQETTRNDIQRNDVKFEWCRIISHSKPVRIPRRVHTAASARKAFRTTPYEFSGLERIVFVETYEGKKANICYEVVLVY